MTKNNISATPSPITIPWPENISLEVLNKFSKDTLVEHLGIEITDIQPTQMIARMPVDERTRQPLGLLHGGASVVLAETIGSSASNVIVAADGAYGVGLEVNANHLRPATQGYVYASSTLIHLGKSTHVWQTYIYNDQQKLTCTSRLTVAIKKNKA